MARLADICPSSDDELPDIKTLLKKTSTRATRDLSQDDKPSASSKKLTAKSTTKPDSRRVRRLGEGSKTRANPLLQKWDSEQCRGSLDLPGLAKADVRSNNGQVPLKASVTRPSSPSEVEEDEDAEPQSHIRKPRRRRHQIVRDSEDESEEVKGSDDEVDSLLARIRQLRKSRTDATAVPEPSLKSQPPKVQIKGKSGVAVSTKEVDDESEAADDHETNESEDPSAYQTAKDEESTESNEDSADESDWIADSPDRPAKKKVNNRGCSAGVKETASRSRNAPQFVLKTLENGLPALQSNKSRPGKEKALCKDENRTRRLSVNRNSHKLKIPSTTATDLAGSLAKLHLQLDDFSDEDYQVPQPNHFTTPPSTPPKTSKPRGLVSPSKKIQIPKTPHRPSTDAFWDQDLVDDWNEQHSPRKLLLPPVNKSPVKTSPKRKPKEETKKAFAARKHGLAESFLIELDDKITQSKIAELTKSTGGVKLVWTKTLNTTAGRASWRRETTRTKREDGSVVSITHKHHASIELAEKVIDDEHRLMNVLAHEFCHLANFMISGITNNPHGREFKMWAAQCSRAFGGRGIEVTTKHSYDIDFKYMWECEACAAEYKRHSKSIDPQRHRCGSCKGLLKQTRPVPRGQGVRGPSRYQEFVRDQMAVVRGENPGSPQKVVMKLIAEKWAKQEGKAPKRSSSTGMDGFVGKMVDLTLGEK